MNVLLTDATDIYAGGEEYVLILARHLRNRGHAVWVSALPGHLLLRKCDDAGIPTVPVAYRGMDRVFAVGWQLRNILRERSIDVLHSNANYDRTCAGIATAFSPTRHIAGVHSTHSIQHNITHWIRNRWGVDRFITDAEAGRVVLIRQDHIPPHRVITVPIGIDAEPAGVREASRQRTRRDLGLGDDTVAVGTVARLVPFKGHRVLLRAAALLLKQHPDTVLLLVGDGELLDDLQRQARELGITGNVRFLGFRDDLPELYPAFDVYCHSSLDMASEMFPIAILRALATGLPVVATAVGGVAGMVEDGGTGYLVPADAPPALASSLARLVGDMSLRTRMGRRAAEMFAERFDAARMAERIEAIYTSV